MQFKVIIAGCSYQSNAHNLLFLENIKSCYGYVHNKGDILFILLNMEKRQNSL